MVVVAAGYTSLAPVTARCDGSTWAVPSGRCFKQHRGGGCVPAHCWFVLLAKLLPANVVFEASQQQDMFALSVA